SATMRFNEPDRTASERSLSIGIRSTRQRPLRSIRRRGWKPNVGTGIPFWNATRLPPSVLKLSVGASSEAASGLAHPGRTSPSKTLARTRPANRRAGRNEGNYAAKSNFGWWLALYCFEYDLVREVNSIDLPRIAPGCVHVRTSGRCAIPVLVFVDS